ncbi:MAG: glycosyltransferase family 4 protein [Cellulosilyticaceae bacterium]
MKILFIYQYCLLGGVTTQLVNRLEGLQDEWEVHFLFLGEYGGKTAFKNQEHVYIANTSKQFKKLLDYHQYDAISVIDTNQVYEWLKYCEYKGLIINEVHTTTKNLDKINQLKNEKRIHLICTPSVYMKNVIENTYGFKGQIPIEVIPNCIDLNVFRRSIQPLMENKPMILWVGKLDDHKRWYDFLEIARKLTYEYKRNDLQYVMVGGATASQPQINELMRQLGEKKLMDKVKWYSSIPYGEMYKIYNLVRQSGGVYASTTENESFGMTVLESMSIGVSIAVPSVGGLVELCEKHRDTTLYTPKNLNMACDKILAQIGKQPEYEVAQYSPFIVCQHFKQIITKYLNELKLRGGK